VETNHGEEEEGGPEGGQGNPGQKARASPEKEVRKGGTQAQDCRAQGGAQAQGRDQAPGAGP
jgi:hypothetical protein